MHYWRSEHLISTECTEIWMRGRNIVARFMADGRARRTIEAPNSEAFMRHLPLASFGFKVGLSLIE